ncbi:MAG: hypothetical protein AB7E79_13300 [Rhodospirillaceae bacterium]
MAKAKAKPKRKAKAVKKTARPPARTRARPAAKKAAPRRRAAKSSLAASSLAKEFGALADQITSFGKAVIEQGTERAGEVARAGMSALGQGGEKIASEIAAIKRAAFTRSRS